MSRIFLIDTDTASDDAIALIMAMRATDVRVAGITTVSGNVNVEQATRNALYVVELCGQDIPVHQGAAKPLARPNAYSLWYHGNDGLGDHGFRPERLTAQKGPAVEKIIDTIDSNPGLTVVALGPLTNIANALTRKPEIVKHVGRCVVMGGDPCGGGNITPAAEYNFWIDPDAARMVMRSRLPIEMIGLNLCDGAAALGARDMELLEGVPGEFSRFALACSSRARQVHFDRTGKDGLSLADPIAMAVALDPSIADRWGLHYVDVEIQSELTRGMTVVDRHDIAGDEYNRPIWRGLIETGAKISVCWAIKPKRWKQALVEALSPAKQSVKG